MFIRNSLTAFVLLAFAAAPSLAETPRSISWDSLLPEVEPYEDPFEEMPFEQVYDLAEILAFETMMNDENAEEAEEYAAKAQALRKKLTEAGLDVDGLFEERLVVMAKREEAATTPNTDLLGESVKLPGYLLPLEFDGRKVVEFLLVPTIGACIHTPPPPANQVVLVSYPEGFEVDELYTPIWISGTLNAQNAVRNVGYSDGNTNVTVSYTMDASLVQLY